MPHDLRQIKKIKNKNKVPVFRLELSKKRKPAMDTRSARTSRRV